jgi:hypothetical protein
MANLENKTTDQAEATAQVRAVAQVPVRSEDATFQVYIRRQDLSKSAYEAATEIEVLLCSEAAFTDDLISRDFDPSSILTCRCAGREDHDNQLLFACQLVLILPFLSSRSRLECQ